MPTTVWIDIKPVAAVSETEVSCSIMLPTGKSLEKPTLDLFEAARINIRRPHPRTIRCKVEGLIGVSQAIFCRPDMIGKMVAEGVADFGITGSDVIEESPDDDVEICTTLNYSRRTDGGTRIVLIAREGDVDSIEKMVLDYDEEKEGVPTIATEYPRQTKKFLRERGIDFPLRSDIRGSVEVLVRERVCRYGVTLVETGATLAANGLKEVAVLSTSSTVLIANKSRLVWEGGWRKDVAQFLSALLVGTLEVRDQMYLLLNAPTADLEEILAVLPSLKSPTVQPLADQGFCSVSAIVPSTQVNTIIRRLQKLGASGFVTLPPSTVM